MLGLEGNPKCDICDAHMIHLGHGIFDCPKCGNEVDFGEEGFSDTGDYDFDEMGVEYDDIYERPESCIGCDGDFPDCSWGCDKYDGDFNPRLKI